MPIPLRKELRDHIGKPCPYCSIKMGGKHQPTRDHIRPRVHGFRFNHNLNKIIVCYWCNITKRDLTLEEWLLNMQMIKYKSRLIQARIINVSLLLERRKAWAAAGIIEAP